MKINIEHIQYILSNHDYLEFDRILTNMYNSEKNKQEINVFKNNTLIKTLKNFDDIENFKKYMVQIYGLFGFI